jgi:hypothetical protein
MDAMPDEDRVLRADPRGCGMVPGRSAGADRRRSRLTAYRCREEDRGKALVGRVPRASVRSRSSPTSLVSPLVAAAVRGIAGRPVVERDGVVGGGRVARRAVLAAPPAGAAAAVSGTRSSARWGISFLLKATLRGHYGCLPVGGVGRPAALAAALVEGLGSVWDWVRFAIFRLWDGGGAQRTQRGTEERGGVGFCFAVF